MPQIPTSEIKSKQSRLSCSAKTYLAVSNHAFYLSFVFVKHLLSGKDPVVTFLFKNGNSEKIDEAFQTLETTHEKIMFSDCFTNCFPKTQSGKLLFPQTIWLTKRYKLEEFEQKQKQITKCLVSYSQKENKTIKLNLEGKCLYNMTDITLDTVKAEKWIELGKNFNPLVKHLCSENVNHFSSQIKVIVQELLYKSERIKRVFDKKWFTYTVREAIIYNPFVNRCTAFH